MLPHELSLELELYDGDGLVHLCDEAKPLLVVRCLLTVVRCLLTIVNRTELQAGVVGVGLHRKRGERQEVDAVALFERGQVGEAQREAQHDGDARVLTGSGAHPKCIVITPLQVEVLAGKQVVHDDVGARTTVEDVAQNVELVDAQLVDDIADGRDEVTRLPDLHDCLNDALHVCVLVLVVRAFV